MIYDIPAALEELSQGDIIDGCPILFWEYLTAWRVLRNFIASWPRRAPSCNISG